MRGGVGLASSGTGGEGKVDAVVSATACVHRRLPAAPPRRALGVEASARGLVRGRPRGRGLRVILTDLVLVHAVAALVVVDEVVFAIAAPLAGYPSSRRKGRAGYQRAGPFPAGSAASQGKSRAPSPRRRAAVARFARKLESKAQFFFTKSARARGAFVSPRSLGKSFARNGRRTARLSTTLFWAKLAVQAPTRSTEHSGCAGARSVPGEIHQLSRPPHHGLKSEKKFARGYRPRRARDKRDCDAEMPPSEEVAMVEEKRPTRAGALRAPRAGRRGASWGALVPSPYHMYSRRDHTSYTLELRHEGPDDVQVQRLALAPA